MVLTAPARDVHANEKGALVTHRVDATGGRRFTTWPGASQIDAVLRLGPGLPETDGGAIAAGSRKIGDETPVAMWRFGSDGGPMWTRTMPVEIECYQVKPVAGQLGRLTDGYLVGAHGFDTLWDFGHSFAFRTDFWGHVSCAEAGLCGEKALETCDDNDPCTADACNAKTGCTHSTIAGCSP